MRIKLFELLTALMLISYSVLPAETIDQKLVVIQNDGFSGGTFRVALQVKGTDLTSANTLGSATIDIQFDNTQLSYSSSSNWAFGSANGYSRAATNNTTFIRVGVTGSGVNENLDGTPSGFDITSNYTTWVELNFTIINTSTMTNLTIKPSSNAIGLFENHVNNPHTGVINDKPLSPPVEINNTPLPVELTGFYAERQNGSIYLRWTTAGEINNYGFEVERKNEGQDRWEKTGFVKGSGNSNVPKEYSFLDNNVTAGNYFYRLKQVDNNGSFKYSKEISVSFARLPKKYLLYPNFPNPFNPETRIRFDVAKPSYVSLIVYNSLGEKVSVLEDGFLEQGSYQKSFDGGKMASGIYYYVLSASDGVRLVNKMLLIK